MSDATTYDIGEDRVIKIELNLDPNIRPSNLTPNDYLKLAKRK